MRQQATVPDPSLERPECPWDIATSVSLMAGLAGAALCGGRNGPTSKSSTNLRGYSLQLCGLCPFFFEGECCYKVRVAGDPGPEFRLAGVTLSIGDNLITAARAAVRCLFGRGLAALSHVAVLIVCPGAATLSDIEHAMGLFQRVVPSDACLVWSHACSTKPIAAVLWAGWAKRPSVCRD